MVGRVQFVVRTVLHTRMAAHCTRMTGKLHFGNLVLLSRDKAPGSACVRLDKFMFYIKEGRVYEWRTNSRTCCEVETAQCITTSLDHLFVFTATDVFMYFVDVSETVTLVSL